MAGVPVTSRGAGAVTLLSTTVLSGDGTFDVQNIDQSYNDLQLVIMARGTVASTLEDLALRFNNDAGASNYQWEFLRGTASAASASNGAGLVSAGRAGHVPASTATANAFGQVTVDIIGYTSTTWLKQALATSSFAQSNAGTAVNAIDTATQWLSTAAINRIQIFGAATANLLSGSVLRVYGRT